MERLGYREMQFSSGPVFPFFGWAVIARMLSEYKSHFPTVKKKKSVNIEDAVK